MRAAQGRKGQRLLGRKKEKGQRRYARCPPCALRRCAGKFFAIQRRPRLSEARPPPRDAVELIPPAAHVANCLPRPAHRVARGLGLYLVAATYSHSAARALKGRNPDRGNS